VKAECLCVAVWCRGLQCVLQRATGCCSVGAVYEGGMSVNGVFGSGFKRVLQCVAVCCSVLQCVVASVAVCFSVLQCGCSV